jgi:1-acyl-sn-glycerol-3-phosphate acyltransferase
MAMAVKIKQNAKQSTQGNAEPKAQTGSFSKLWLLYFIFMIGLVGACTAYLLCVPLYLLGRWFPRCLLIADRTLQRGVFILMSLQPWLKADVNIDVVAPLSATVHTGRLLVSNHRSHLDAFLLLSRVSGIRIMAKSAIFSVPFLGLIMRLSRQIPVERGRVDAFFAAMDVVRARLRAGQTVHIFPEMTRCAPGYQGTLGFSSAPFLAALQENVPVIPIAFRGTDSAWPRGTFGLSFRQPIEARALEPILPGQFTTADALRTEAKRRIDEALK